MARTHPETPIEIGLAAAVVTVEANAPRILVGTHARQTTLPGCHRAASTRCSTARWTSACATS